jgi:hypothetical protein
MARLPRVDKLTVEQLNSFKEEERLEKLLPALNGLIDGTGFLNKQLTLGDNMAAKVFTVSVDMPATDPTDWVDITFSTGWYQWVDANYPNCRIRKDPSGVVHLDGLVGNTSGVIGTVATFDAAKYAPDKSIILHSANQSGATSIFIVTAAGELKEISGSLASWISIGGLLWTAADRTTPVADCFPLYQKWDLPSPPTLCWVGAVRDREDNSQLALNPMSLQWEYVTKDGAGAIKVNNVTGLQYGRKYAITLVGLVG